MSAVGALVAVLAFAGQPSFAAPSATAHAIPGGGGAGITVLCYSASGFSCAGAGYNGTAGQIGGLGWGTGQYWSYGSAAAGGARHNCTTYAAFRLQTNGVSFPGWTDNANGWDNKAWPAVNVDQSPAVGAIAQWNGGAAGHVAYVEAVGPGYIETTSDSYGGGTDHLRISSSAPSWPDNFIHFRDQAGGAPADGTFVSRQGSGEVYVMAGESPLYVSTWDAFGGGKPVQTLSPAQFDSLRPQPLDGTFLYGTRTGRVFSVAGGAPIYVSNWNNVGGQAGKRLVGVDDWAIDNAGNPLSHLLARPEDGAFIGAGPSGRVLTIAGGAPVYVSNWDSVGGPRAVAPVDDWSVDNAGNPLSHLNPVPDNGTYLAAQPSGRVFITAWGAPLYVSSWDHMGGPKGTVTVDDWAVDNAGNPSSHLAPRPYDGNYILGRPSGRVFRVAGGSPIYVSDWARVGGAQPVAAVDDWAIDQAGHPFSHLFAFPADGTLLRAQPSGARWQVSAGQRSLSAGAGGIVVDEAGLARIPLRSEPASPGGGGTTVPRAGDASGGSGASGGGASGGGASGGTRGVRSGSVCRVPKLVGLTPTAARTRLIRHGCRLGVVTYVGRANRRADRVISVKRRVGLTLGAGARVSIVVRR